MAYRKKNLRGGTTVPLFQYSNIGKNWKIAVIGDEAYYQSSGTSSNQVQFPKTFFPTLGVAMRKYYSWPRGGIIKVGSTGPEAGLVRSIHASNIWRKSLCELLVAYNEMCKNFELEYMGNNYDKSTKKIKYLYRDEKSRIIDLDLECCHIYAYFLDKFETFDQVKNSELLGGNFWDSDEGQLLKNVVLTYNRWVPPGDVSNEELEEYFDALDKWDKTKKGPEPIYPEAEPGYFEEEINPIKSYKLINETKGGVEELYDWLVNKKAQQILFQ